MRSLLKRGLAPVLALMIPATAVVAVASPAAAQEMTAAELLSLLPVAAETNADTYNRDLFPHWVDADGDGCNTREEVLIEASLVTPTVDADCTVTAGEWYSWYDGGTWTHPADVDIDHVVALAESWQSGAHAWAADRRELFANDLDFHASLEAVTDEVNASKGAQDPAEWLPPLRDTHCDYAIEWSAVKYRWDLTIDTAERSALQSVISGDCASQVVPLPSKGGGATPPPDLIEPGVHRLSGADRFATAVAISKDLFPTAGPSTVYIVTGLNFPDALGAGPAAGYMGGVVLPVATTSIPSVVADELRRLDPGQIVVVGGPSVVGDNVFAELRNHYAPTVRRLYGVDRYATAATVALDAFGADGAPGVLIATGEDYPDALAGGAIGAGIGMPVLLTGSGSLPTSTRQALQQLQPGFIDVLGGPGVVSDTVMAALGEYTSGPVTRLSGSDRYATAVDMSQEYFDSSPTVYLATGRNFPDALAGGPAAGRDGAPLLLSGPNCLPAATANEIKRLGAVRTVVLGGTGVVSDAAASGTVCVATPPPPPPPPLPPGAANVQIDRVQYDSPGSDDGSNASRNDEFVVLINRGTAGTNIGGWTLRDTASHVYTFPSYSLAAGASVVVHTGSGTNGSGRLYWGSGSYIWNNTGDTATLRNSGGGSVDACGWSSLGSGFISC